MPRLLPSQYARILYALTQDTAGDELDRRVEIFAKYIRSERMWTKMPYIEKAFIQYARKQAGAIPLTVETVRPLTVEEQQIIKKIMKSTAEIVEVTNPECIGGVKIRTDEVIVDATMKGQLEKLHHALRT